MPEVTKDAYLRVVENRPFKFSDDEVGYTPGEGDHVCSRCIHFFTRNVDSFHTCEIFRPDDDDAVLAAYRCDFWTDDGEEFPLLEE